MTDRLSFRCPHALKKRLTKIAKEEGVSVAEGEIIAASMS